MPPGEVEGSASQKFPRGLMVRAPAMTSPSPEMALVKLVAMKSTWGKTSTLKKDLEPIDKFLKEMGIKEIASQPKLSVTRTNLPASTQVIVLDYTR